jgi:tetratricopeptide (TPR) repeat protein
VGPFTGPGFLVTMAAVTLRAALVLCLALAGCQKATAPAAAPAAPDAGAVIVAAPEPKLDKPDKKDPIEPQRLEPTVATPRIEPLAVCESKGRLPIDAAREFFDAGKFEQALSCAAQACALFPHDPLAHTERANALAALNRPEEAKLAYARALAIDPDNIDALWGAAHFYGVTLSSSREFDELASTYAERGFELARAQKDDEAALELGRISSMVFNDLGQASEALDRAQWVLSVKAKDPGAQYEKAVALFELCRFAQAKEAFLALVGDSERAAHAQHHLGLLAERDGKLDEASKHFAAARKARPDDFADPVAISAEEFKAEAKKVIAALPPDMAKDLREVPVETEDLPQVEDLTSGEPPLSPTILGLFRGPPLTEACDPIEAAAGRACRTVVLYRKNLARAVKSKAELIEQIRVTLLHEIGHLRGEDDFELAARGLE